jgi:diguanylate cyclase (GGDEF)-like protein
VGAREQQQQLEHHGLHRHAAGRAVPARTRGRRRREQRPLSLALIDLDHFKRFNDELGHGAGDHLLKSAAAAWSRQIRASDMLARVGGEEFVLVLPNADVEMAAAVVSKLRSATPLGQTFSAGVAEWDIDALPEELINAADAAMYEAKRAGRDRVERAAAGCVKPLAVTRPA